MKLRTDIRLVSQEINDSFEQEVSENIFPRVEVSVSSALLTF